MLRSNTFPLRKGIFFGFLFILFYLFFYLPYLSRYIYGGDSAELATTLTTWSVSHPPGYPLYTFLGNLATYYLFFIKNKITIISFLTSLFTLISLYFLFFSLLSLQKNWFTALATSLAFMFLFPIWLYSLVPEVFSLAILLVLFQFFLIILMTNKNQFNIIYLFLFFFSLGLCISHHHIIFFFLPSYFYFFWQKKRFFGKIKKYYLLFSFFFLLGCLFYLYPPLASRHNPPIDVENAETFDGFLRLITRSSYGTFKAFPYSGGDLINRLFDLFSAIIFIIHDLKPLGLILIILGFFYLRKINRFFFNFFLINLSFILFFIFYTNFGLFNNFGVATYERFLVFLYLVLIYYLFIGLNFLGSLINKIKNRLSNKISKKIAEFVYRGLIFILIISIFKSNFTTLSQLPNLTDFENYGYDLLKSTPAQSILWLNGDNDIFITSYFLYSKKLRTDVALIKSYTFSRDYLIKRLKKNFSQIYVPNNNKLNSKEFLKIFLEKNYFKEIPIVADTPAEEGIWVPNGLLWKFYPTKEEFEKERLKIIADNYWFWNSVNPPHVDKKKANFLFLGDIQTHYAKQFWSFINFLMVNGQENEALTLAKKNFNLYKNNYYFLLLYTALKLSHSDCSGLKSIVDPLIKKKLIQKSEEYNTIIAYYQICENNPSILKKIINEYKKIKIIEEQPLDKL